MIQRRDFIFSEEALTLCKNIEHNIDNFAGGLNNQPSFNSYRTFINKKIYEPLDMLEFKTFLSSPEEYQLNLTHFFKPYFEEKKAAEISTLIVTAHFLYFKKGNLHLNYAQMAEKLKNVGFINVPEESGKLNNFYSQIIETLEKTMEITFPVNSKNSIRMIYSQTRKLSTERCKILQDYYVEALNSRINPAIHNYINATKELRQQYENEIAKLALEILPKHQYLAKLLQKKGADKKQEEENVLEKAVLQAKEKWHAKIENEPASRDAFASVRTEEIAEQYLKNIRESYFGITGGLFAPKPIPVVTRPIPPTIGIESFRR